MTPQARKRTGTIAECPVWDATTMFNEPVSINKRRKEGQPYGYLRRNNKPITSPTIMVVWYEEK